MRAELGERSGALSSSKASRFISKPRIMSRLEWQTCWGLALVWCFLLACLVGWLVGWRSKTCVLFGHGFMFSCCCMLRVKMGVSAVEKLSHLES